MSDKRTIADLADDLTNPIRVREAYTVWINRNRKVEHWEHTLPSLLDQLAAAVVPGESYTEGGSFAHSPRSMPPARIEAISSLLQIDAGAATWVIEAGITLRRTTASNIRALVGANLPSDAQTLLRGHMRRWYGWAATMSGWERIFKPDSSCPICAVKGYLRVNLTRQTATCMIRDQGETGCGETWAEDNIGILAQHIERTSAKPHYDTAHLRTAAVRARRAQEDARYTHETRRPAVLAGLLDQPNG